MIDPAVTIAADPAAAAAVVPIEAPNVEQIDKAPVEKSNFTDAELREFKAKGNTPSKTDPAPVEPKPAEAKTEIPPKVDPPAPPKHQPKPDAEARIKQLARENRELRERLAAPPKPAEPAPAKTEAPAIVDADPEPDIEKYSAEEAPKFFKDQSAWSKRETARQVEAALKARDTKDEQSKAATAAKEQQAVLDAAKDAIETEFPDWSDVVLGTDEADGIAARLSADVQSWCDSDPEVSFRGLYELAKLPAAEQEAFFKLNNVRKVAKLVQLGEQKTSAPAPVAPAPGAGKRAAPPPKTVTGPVTPAADPMKAIINAETITDADVRAFKEQRNAAERSSQRR